jgi:hypothetical protein
MAKTKLYILLLAKSLFSLQTESKGASPLVMLRFSPVAVPALGE